MAKQKIKTTIKVKRIISSSKITKDKNGRKHCKTCGAFIGNKGRK